MKKKFKNWLFIKIFRAEALELRRLKATVKKQRGHIELLMRKKHEK